MARASATYENAAITGGNAGVADIGLNTGDPSTTGANEMSVTPYGRQGVTMGTPSSGSAVNTNAPAVPMNASSTVTHFSLWSAATAGTYEIGGVLGSSLTTGATAATVTFAAGSISTGAS